jgi:hypothetical protein
MQTFRLAAVRCLTLLLIFSPAAAGSGLAQQLFVTPSERVTRFVNVRAEPSAG